MNRKTKELNRLNNELDSKINDGNQEVFTDIICYLRGSAISDYDQELVRQDLLEMILSAQERGEDIETVIGEDYKEFCDSIIASLPKKTLKQRTVSFLDIACWCLAILGAINIVMSRDTINIIRNLVSGQAVDFHISVSAGTVISIGVVLAAAVLIVEYIVKNPFKKDGAKKGAAAKGFAAGACIMSFFLLIAYLGSRTLFTVNLFAAIVIVLGLYAAHKVLAQL